MNKTARVRYKYDGFVYNSKEMLAGDDTVSVSINAKEGFFNIYDSKGNVTVKGTGKNYGELKKLVKAELEKLGVNFVSEVRDTKKKRIARGENTIKPEDLLVYPTLEEKKSEEQAS